MIHWPSIDNLHKVLVKTKSAVTPFALPLGIALILLLISKTSFAQGIPAVTLETTEEGGTRYSVTIQVLAIMTALTFIPAALMMMTSFTRIIVVFAILRQAIGLQQTPSNQMLIGLALFLTFFIMAPVFNQVNAVAIQPYIAEEILPLEAIDRAVVPVKTFMIAQTRESDLELFIRLADEEGNYIEPMEVPLNILMPAFVTSELKTAFQIGFLLFIPFLIIDLVIASILMAMGMMMLSPIIISLPFKIMLFVLVDGWAMVMGSVAASFNM